MLKSMRWSLQLWHAGLLTAVLAGLGSASYYDTARVRYHEFDSRLERAVQKLATGLRPPHGPPGPPATAPEGPPPARRPRDRHPMQFELPAELAASLTEWNAYYILWDTDDKVVAMSANAGDVPMPSLTRQWPPGPTPPQLRQRGELREACLDGPFDVRFVLGMSIRQEQAALRHLAWRLVAMGAGVLLIGLAGGWLLSSRMMRPIQAITTVAQNISASRLSERIDVAAVKSELGTLATVLNDAFARLEAAFQQQVRFTADASHELRTPLAVIHTHAQLALSRERSAEDYRQLFETCLRSSNRMKELVDSLLLLAKADAGRLVMNRASLDLSDVVAEYVELTAPLAAKQGITIETQLQSVELSADASMVGEVVTNLLANGIRYSRPGSQIRVAVEAVNSDAVLTVADQGVGIPPESQPRLFERFFRVNGARSRDDGGSGLGLAICKSIVEAHGGTITFRSQVDVGTCFTVRFPLAGPPGNS